MQYLESCLIKNKICYYIINLILEIILFIVITGTIILKLVYLGMLVKE